VPGKKRTAQRMCAQSAEREARAKANTMLGSLTQTLHGGYERERTRFYVDLLPRFLALLLVQCEGILPLLRRVRTLAYRAPAA
jgi:hypothetical protein